VTAGKYGRVRPIFQNSSARLDEAEALVSVTS
jgi:hypothetical protein